MWPSGNIKEFWLINNRVIRGLFVKETNLTWESERRSLLLLCKNFWTSPKKNQTLISSSSQISLSLSNQLSLSPSLSTLPAEARRGGATARHLGPRAATRRGRAQPRAGGARPREGGARPRVAWGEGGRSWFGQDSAFRVILKSPNSEIRFQKKSQNSETKLG